MDDELIPCQMAEACMVSTYGGQYRCSNCKRQLSRDFNPRVRNSFNYCPNCGLRITSIDNSEIERAMKDIKKRLDEKGF